MTDWHRAHFHPLALDLNSLLCAQCGQEWVHPHPSEPFVYHDHDRSAPTNASDDRRSFRIGFYCESCDGYDPPPEPRFWVILEFHGGMVHVRSETREPVIRAVS